MAVAHTTADNGSRNGFISSAIRGHKTSERQGRFTLYKVEVKDGQRTWIVERSYSDFFALNKEVKMRFPSFRLTLPPRDFIKNRFDHQFIEMRKRGLEAFMECLFSLEDVMKAEPVKKFFRLDNPPGPDEDLTVCRDYCHTLKMSLEDLKQNNHDQECELGRLRRELKKMQERALRVEQELECMKLEKNLEQSKREDEQHQREQHVKELLREFHDKQQQAYEAVKSRVAAFADCAKVSVSFGGTNIDFKTMEGVAERKENLNKAITEAWDALYDLHKGHLEHNRSEIDELKADQARLEHQLQTANAEAVEIRKKQQQLEAIEEHYFSSLILGFKLNMDFSELPQDALNQLTPSLLLARARAQGISIEHWPRWISKELAHLVNQKNK